MGFSFYISLITPELWPLMKPKLVNIELTLQKCLNYLYLYMNIF